MPDPTTGPPFEVLAKAVDEAASQVAGLDDGPRAAAEELRAAIEAAHRAGLVTIVRKLRGDAAGKALLYELVDDPLIRMLFSLHGIIRTDPPEGIGAAGGHAVKDAAGDSCAGGGCGCGSAHSPGGPQPGAPTLIPLSAIGLRPWSSA